MKSVESVDAQKKRSLERELKFAEVEHDRLRDRLIEMEAERVWSSALEENWLFDQGGKLEKGDRLLRLRRDTRGAWLTYKGPAKLEGRVKVRLEHETEVGDADETRALLESLGYEVTRRYEKKRELWRVGGVTVALDRTPIGDFAELEGEAAEALSKRLGLDPDRAERRNYLRLYQDYREDNPDAPPDMTFEPEEA